MKRNLLLSALLSLVAYAAHSETRLSWYDAAKSTCSSLQGALAREGRIVLVTGPALYTTPVREASMCMPGETTKSVSVKARDGKCSVGFTCHTR